MSNKKLILEYTQDLNILYVEDDLLLLHTTKELLSIYFKNVDIAINGKEGLEKFIDKQKNSNNSYDLIITDINMPHCDGIEMSIAIRKINPNQAIVITTAHNEISYLQRAIEIGVDGFISKPINNEQLLKVFYKVSQAISDHKFVLEHVDMLEELNFQLEQKNKELAKKNTELEKSFRMLDTMVHKEQITQISTIEIPPSKGLDDRYVQEQIDQLINDDLYELIELNAEIDLTIINILNSADQIKIDNIEILSSLFSRYSSVLAFYNFFDDLSSSISKFAKFIKENPLPQNTQTLQNIFMLLESFSYVLSKWQSDLALSEIDKINSLDASMISDMQTITNMWIEDENELNDNALDEIFDF